jgi:hypothetical protein
MSPMTLLASSFNDGFVGQGLNPDGVFEQSPEEQASASRAPAVESKGELIEVVIELLGADRPLVRSQQPALQQGDDQVHSWHQIHGGLSAPSGCPNAGRPVVKTSLGQTCVARPPVRMDQAASGYNIRDKSAQLVLRCRAYPTHSDSSQSATFLLNRHGDERFQVPLTTSKALFQSTDGGLVNLDRAVETVAIWSHHCRTEFVQPDPGRLVAAESQVLLQRERAGSVLLTGDQPNRLEPHGQGLVRVLKDGPGGNPSMVLTGSADDDPLAGPAPAFPATAAGAPESVRPPQPDEVVKARSLGRELFDELHQSAWVILDAGKLN